MDETGAEGCNDAACRGHMQVHDIPHSENKLTHRTVLAERARYSSDAVIRAPNYFDVVNDVNMTYRRVVFRIRRWRKYVDTSTAMLLWKALDLTISVQTPGTAQHADCI